MIPIFRVRGTELLREAILRSMASHGTTSISEWFLQAALSYLAWDVDLFTDAEKAAFRASVTKLPKTHCPSGHPYSPENTKMRGNVKTCRICHRLQVKKSAMRRDL